MHALISSSTPPLIYWNETTIRLIKNIQQWRNEGFKCYFTIDAGPNVVVLCLKQDMEELKNRFQKIDNVQNVINCKPGPAPYISEQHLF